MFTKRVGFGEPFKSSEYPTVRVNTRSQEALSPGLSRFYPVFCTPSSGHPLAREGIPPRTKKSLFRDPIAQIRLQLSDSLFNREVLFNDRWAVCRPPLWRRLLSAVRIVDFSPSSIPTRQSQPVVSRLSRYLRFTCSGTNANLWLLLALRRDF